MHCVIGAQREKGARKKRQIIGRGNIQGIVQRTFAIFAWCSLPGKGINDINGHTEAGTLDLAYVDRQYCEHVRLVVAHIKHSSTRRQNLILLPESLDWID